MTEPEIQPSRQRRRWRRRILTVVLVVVGTVLVTLTAWAVAIGPVEVWRVVTHGTTTVWDHLEYPGRDLHASPQLQPWPEDPIAVPTVIVDGGVPTPVDHVLSDTDSLSLVVIRDGAIRYEWHAPEHDASTPSMLFSVSKSIVSLLVGAAIDDGLIGSVDDPVTEYVPEMADGGFDQVTIKDLLQMRSSSTYVENDNPFGVHVEFNYSADLTSDILGLAVRSERDREFTYRSGDNAILGLILHRVVAPRSVTEYLQERFLDPLGAEHAGRWSTDIDGGLERSWCCLALTATDLARFGQLVLDDGAWGGTQIVDRAWLTMSASNGHGETWPADYQGSSYVGYGYQWWLVDGGGLAALGKDGQYLLIDPANRAVVVRTGTSEGGIGWIRVLRQLASTPPQ